MADEDKTNPLSNVITIDDARIRGLRFYRRPAMQS
jgi:hypothetical protein